ncbi:methyltransferase domain-containing protein [Candidatus Micrarchaeota archaeon]|nr:methyltransferase domain-containing protein [Candidatus Micrarchaeota archaeon]
MRRDVKEFYEQYPYPQLPVKKKADLLSKLHGNVMREILETTGRGASYFSGKNVLEAGCGTGEKCVYFALHGAHVRGVDISNASLAHARKLADKFNVKVGFENADVLQMHGKEKFGYIYSLGVLHHTENPKKGFCNIAKMLKKGGIITIGLYSASGRLLHRMHRAQIALFAGKGTKERMQYVERNIYGRKLRAGVEEAYVADKYAHPYESYHTVGEVLGWFGENGIKPVGCHPKCGFGFLSRKITQMEWMAQRKTFFVMSGRRI